MAGLVKNETMLVCVQCSLKPFTHHNIATNAPTLIHNSIQIDWDHCFETADFEAKQKRPDMH